MFGFQLCNDQLPLSQSRVETWMRMIENVEAENGEDIELTLMSIVATDPILKVTPNN